VADGNEINRPDSVWHDNNITVLTEVGKARVTQLVSPTTGLNNNAMKVPIYETISTQGIAIVRMIIQMRVVKLETQEMPMHLGNHMTLFLSECATEGD
jgi:hypothetical protein